MIVEHQLRIDLIRNSVTQQIATVQDDKYTRNMVLHLYSGGVPWEPPRGATVITSYVKKDGVGGVYDTMPDDTLAYSVSGNVVTVKLAPQVLTVVGPVRVNVGIISGTEEISTFEIRINVQRNVAREIKDSEYYQNITGFMPLPATAKVGQYFRAKEVNEFGKVTAVEAVDAPDGSGSTDILDVSDLLGYGTASSPIDLSDLDLTDYTTLYFSKGTYYVAPLDLNGIENLTILADGATLILTGEYFITGRDCHGFKMIGGVVNGNHNAVYGIQLIDSQNGTFVTIGFFNFGGDDKENVSMLNLFGDCTGFLVDHCTFDGSDAGVVSSDGFIHAYGIFVNRLGSSKTYSKSGIIRQCSISNIAGTDSGDTKADGDAIFVQAPPYLDDNGDLVIPEAKISIEHCIITDCKKRGVKSAAHGVEIDSCIFDGDFWYSCADFQYGHGRISRSRLTNTSDYNGSITSALVASDGGVDVDDCTFSAPYTDTEGKATYHPGIRLGKRLSASVIDAEWDTIRINKCRFDGVSRAVFAYNSTGESTGYILNGLEITDCEIGAFNQTHVVELNSNMFEKILAYKFTDFRFDYGANRTEVAAVNAKFTYPHSSNIEFVNSFELHSRYWDNEPMSGYDGLPTATHTRIVYAGSGMGNIDFKVYTSKGSFIRGNREPSAITSTLSKQLLYNSRVGDIYVNTTTGEILTCVSAGSSDNVGTWAVSAGGSGGGSGTGATGGVDGADGLSTYYAPFELADNRTGVIGRSISEVETAGRTLQVGDLLITSNAVLMRVTSVTSTQYNASKVAVLVEPGSSDSGQNGDGLTTTEKNLILSLFKNAAYTADMSATIAQLETLWNETPDAPESGVEQIGSVLSIVSGVTVNQNGSVLAIA